MDEISARRVVLAQAIETADTQGKLLAEPERTLVDQQALQAAQSVAATGPMPAEQFLDLRAQRVLAAAGERHRAIADLQHPSPWRGGLMAAVLLATTLLGALTERIADPHRVDLLSLPLIAIVLWNLLVYLFMLAGWMAPRRVASKPVLDTVGRWGAGVRRWGGRSGHLRADVTAQFHLLWTTVTAPLQAQRWKAMLHLAALGWAAGVAASLLVQGLVVEYRVGWESTFLDARQVHAILSILLLPVTALFPFDAFTVQDIARLQLGPGGAGQVERRWVWMYVALLLVVVVVPRAVLAAVALARAKLLAGRVRLDLRERYFQRIVSLLHPAQIGLGLVTHRPEDRAILLRVLARDQEHEASGALIRSAAGDTLRLVDVPADIAPPSGAGAAGSGWLQRVMGYARNSATSITGRSGDARLDAARECQVILHAAGSAGEIKAARPLLQWLDKPVLVLASGPEALAVQPQLSFDSFARCWAQEGVLLDAIGRLMPEALVPGFERITVAWHARNRARFERSMQAAAGHLFFAARQVEEIPGGALSMKSLVVAGERQAQALARQSAMRAVVERLGESAARMSRELSSLHGVDDGMADAAEEGLEQKFAVHQPVDAQQAAMAGAAGGAATGVSVDLLAGGLTLGAATALGALVGAGAAFIGAAWKNRSTPGGATVVQLSDEMMQALAQAALLRYLATVHHGRTAAGGGAIDPSWKADVAAAVEARHARLAPLWATARTKPDPALATSLARELEAIAAEVLDRLYPKP